jgi:hypothetical protein
MTKQDVKGFVNDVLDGMMGFTDNDGGPADAVPSETSAGQQGSAPRDARTEGAASAEKTCQAGRHDKAVRYDDMGRRPATVSEFPFGE